MRCNRELRSLIIQGDAASLYGRICRPLSHHHTSNSECRGNIKSMNQAWLCSIPMSCSDPLCKKSEKWESERFIKQKGRLYFFFLPFVTLSFLSLLLRLWVLNGAFFTWIDILLVSVFYLLMCCRLKVGREDEPAHWYYRLLRRGMSRVGWGGREVKGTTDGWRVSLAEGWINRCLLVVFDFKKCAI